MLSLHVPNDVEVARMGTAPRRLFGSGSNNCDFPMGLHFNFTNSAGVETAAPQLTASGRPMGFNSATKRTQDHSWDGFDVYCNTFRVRRTSILTLMTFVLALSCIGGATVISLSFYSVADAIIETERIIDPVLTASIPLVRHAGSVMDQAQQASATVGVLLNHSIAAADAAAPAVRRATAMLDSSAILVERMARLARHPTLRVEMDSD